MLLPQSESLKGITLFSLALRLCIWFHLLQKNLPVVVFLFYFLYWSIL